MVKQIIILIFVIAAFTIRLDLIAIKFFQLEKLGSGMVFAPIILPLIYLPMSISQQASKMIKIFNECLKVRVNE